MPRAAAHDNNRVALRVRPADKAVIMRAVALAQTDMTSFILRTALREAQSVIEQHERVLAVLGEAAPPFEHQLGRADVRGAIAIRAAGNHLALDRTAHVGDFFGPFVDEQHHDMHFRMILGDRLGNVLQQDGLAGSR